jgi:hypothetical protein
MSESLRVEYCSQACRVFDRRLKSRAPISLVNHAESKNLALELLAAWFTLLYIC